MMHQQGLFAMALLCGPIVPLSNGEVTPRADLSVAEGEFVSPNRNPEPRHAAPRALRTDDKVSEGCAWLSITKAKFAVIVLVGMTVMSLFGCMFQPPQGAGGGNSIRLPPRWEPAMETTLPFRTWMQDLMLWTIGTDLAPHQQAVAIISQLGGPARDLARTLTPGELYNGGVINGQALDPVSFLLHGLSSRFAPLDEENRLRAAQDLLSFARRQGESIDALISRFDITRELARREGGGAVAIETAALILLRACGVSSEQFQTLTQPFGLRLPANDAEFSQLCHHLRRMAHIVERHPNNIASGLRQTSQAHFSQASFLAEADTGSSHSAEHWQQGSGGLEYTGVDASGSMDWAFAAAVNGAEGSGTDSETSSDHDEPLPVEDLQGMTNGQERQLTPDPWSQNADPWMQWLQDEARPGGEQAMLMGADLNNEGVLEETHPPPTGDDDPQASEADEFMSPPEHAFPWWPVPDHQPAVSGTGPQHASAYHSNVRLPDGRVGLLIDPGSYGNLVGAQWLEEAATSMRTTPGMTRRSHPLQVGGVGKGEHHLFADDDPLDFEVPTSSQGANREEVMCREVCERFEYERAAETLLTLVSDWECQGQEFKGSQRFEGQSGCSLGLGAFTFGGKTGITKATVARPWLTRMVANMVRCKAPEATFSAVMVGVDMISPVHTDRFNVGSNTLVPVRVPQHGGGLWVELLEGDRVAGPIKVRQHRSELIAGQVHELIEGQSVRFNPKARHASEPWTRGQRVVLAAYTAGSLSKLTSDEVTQLIEWDFKLPDVVAKPPASGSGPVRAPRDTPKIKPQAPEPSLHQLAEVNEPSNCNRTSSSQQDASSSRIRHSGFGLIRRALLITIFHSTMAAFMDQCWEPIRIRPLELLRDGFDDVLSRVKRSEVEAVWIDMADARHLGGEERMNHICNRMQIITTWAERQSIPVAIAASRRSAWMHPVLNAIRPGLQNDITHDKHYEANAMSEQNAHSVPSHSAVHDPGKPDDLITIGESIAGFPTESKIMQKQRRKDDQAQGIVSVPKRKRKIVEQHFDDCGEDLSSLSAPVFQYLASNSSESSEDEGVEIVELRGNEGNSSKLCVRRKLRQHPAADVAQSLAAFCGRVAEAQRAQSRYFLVEQPSPSNLFATPPWPTVCNDPGCYRVIYHQCQAAQPTAERLTKETIELVGNDVELLKPLSNLQCDGIAHGIEMLVRRVFPSVPYWEPKSPGLRGSSLGREAEQQVESRLRRLTNLLKPELKSLLQSTAQASDTVTRLPNADCSGTECDYKVGDTVDWWREPVHKDAPGWRGPGRIIDLSRLEHGRIGVRTNTDQVITCRLQDVRHSLAFASEELSIFFGAEDHIAPAGSHASHAQQYAQAYVDQLKSGSVLTLGHVRTATGQWVETPQTSEHRAVYQACVYVAEVVFQLTNIAAVRLARGARTLTLRDEFVNSLVLWWNAPGSRNISFVHTEASRVSCASLADGHWEGIHLIQFLCVPDCEGWATTARWRVPSLSELPSMPPASTPAASEPDNRSRLSTVPEETEPSEAASLVTWRELCNTFGESIRQSEILPLQEAYEAVVNEEAPGRPQEFTLEQLKIEVTAASMSQAEIPHWSQVGTVSECHWATETQLRELTATCDVEEFVALDADEHGAYVALEAYGDMCKVIDGLDRLPEEGEHVELRMYETHTRKAVIDRSDDLLTDEEARENADLVTQDGQLVMILVKHVDDLKIAGLRHRIEAFIKHVSNTFGKMEVEWSTFTFCGVCHTQSEDGSICLDQIRFLSACKPIVQTSVMSGSPEELLPEDARRQFLSLLMTIAYGLLTRPDVAVFITALQRESHQAKTIHAKRLNVLLKWLQANPRKITFPAMTRPDALLQISDSSYRAKAEDGLSVRGLVSIRVLLKGIEEGHRDMPCHLLDFASKAQRHVTRSTFSSELFAATDATDIGLLHTIAIHELEHGVLSSADAKRAIDGELECSTKLALVVDAKSVSTAVVAATVKVPAEPSLLLHVCWLRALLSKQRLWRLYWADTRSAEHSHLTTADFRSVAGCLTGPVESAARNCGVSEAFLRETTVGFFK
ncbi:unnamed protein product [Symbiodinium microadriaticum]|nr:unnamed protein product [Symbiodinium microadriaticum]